MSPQQQASAASEAGETGAGPGMLDRQQHQGEHRQGLQTEANDLQAGDAEHDQRGP